MEHSTTHNQDFRAGTVEDIQPGLFYSVLKSALFFNQNGNEVFVLPHTPVYLEKPFEQRPGTISLVKRDHELYVDLFSLDHFTPEKLHMPEDAARIKLIPYFTFAFLRPNSVAAVRRSDLNYDPRLDVVWISRDAPVKNVVSQEYSLALEQDHHNVRAAANRESLRVYPKETPLNGRFVRISGLTPSNLPFQHRVMRILHQSRIPFFINPSTGQ